MKISLNWLQDFIDLTETDAAVLAERITRSVGEIDDVVQQGRYMQHCCVGKITKREQHPNADRLSLVDVETDKGVKRVVCGGSGLRVGMKVAFAHIGATVKHGDEVVTLERAKIRGEESNGMICAPSELDLEGIKDSGGDRPVIDLGDGDDGVGEPLAKYLGKDDIVFHVDNHAITHRADLFSHMGMARELVALGLATWKKKPTNKALVFGKKPAALTLVNDIPKLIPRYCSCTISWDRPGETPQWMKSRLEATGWRSVSLPVDITNYVAMETGMPLHCFDADDFTGDIHMRTTKKGEKITTLDHVERELPEGAIVLSDNAGIFDLLGIMGGLRSSTKDSTKHAYIHAAIVDPVSIRKTIIATGHRTDASTVYEKGIPRVSAEIGLKRALELFLELVPGCKITSTLESHGEDGKKDDVSLPVASVSSVLGKEIPVETMTSILESLGFHVKVGKGKNATLTVTPPQHRSDIRTAQDLVEEIGRIYGYDHIEPVMPSPDISAPPRDHRMAHIRHGLVREGYTELLPLSLTSPEILKKANMDVTGTVRIENPLGEELGTLHPSTLPALLEHAERNREIAGDWLRTFHWGHVFHKTKNGMSEHGELTVFLADMRASKEQTAMNDEPVLVLKREVLAALHHAGYQPSITTAKESPAYAHPGRTADVQLHGKHLGQIYEVHPSVCKRFGLSNRAAAMTINLETLLAIPATVKVPRTLPQFPAVSYDDTVTVSAATNVGEMLKKLRTAHPLVESIDIADLYRGKQHTDGAYNLTLRFTYRAADRTLTEDEAQRAHQEILAGLKGLIG